MIATTADELRQLVDIYSKFDSFVFDLETMYTPTEEEQAKYDEITSVRSADRSIDDAKWLDIFKFKATDPFVNEVIWIGLATYGRSDSVATGHPKGFLIEEAHEVTLPASQAYELDDKRRYTQTGKVSERAIKIKHPATFTEAPPQLYISEALEIMRPLFFNEEIRKINQNLKFDIKSLAKYWDGELMPGPYADLPIGQHILNENIFQKYSLENMVEKFLDHKYEKLGSKGVQNFAFDKAAKYAEQDCRFAWLLWKRIERLLHKTPELWDLHEFEMNRLYGTLMRQEYAGALLDLDTMRQIRVDFQEEADAVIDRLIVEYGAPDDYNPNAATHKRALLYDQYEAPVLKLTDGGKEGKNKLPSTDADAIMAVKIAGGVAGEVAGLMLEYAERSKVISTYLVGMGMLVDKNGKLHPDFVQYGTDTSRLSCREPNLQNIPRESAIRNLFIAPPGYVLIDCDYNQMELRFLCKHAKDTGLQEVFLSDVDVHLATAAKVLKCDPSEVNGSDRTNKGKMPNFLIGYGGTAYLLAEKTGIEVEEAQEILDEYFLAFSNINPWKAWVLRKARERAAYRDGRLVVPPYVETMLKRRRRLPDLVLSTRGLKKDEWKKANRRVLRAERQAVNAVIQGAAGETTKIAMCDIDDHVLETGFPLQMIATVHDEILALCPEDCAQEGLSIMKSKMEGVINPLTGKGPLEGWVPLTADGKISDRWEKA